MNADSYYTQNAVYVIHPLGKHFRQEEGNLACQRQLDRKVEKGGRKPRANPPHSSQVCPACLRYILLELPSRIRMTRVVPRNSLAVHWRYRELESFFLITLFGAL